MSIEYFPFQPGIIAVLIPAGKKSHGNFKTSCLTPATAKKASLSILAEGFFNKFIGVESKFISSQRANYYFNFFVLVVNNCVNNGCMRSEERFSRNAETD